MNITQEGKNSLRGSYERFTHEYINGCWCVVTQPDGIIIARIPSHIAYPKNVALALAQSLTKSKFVLTDLI